VTGIVYLVGAGPGDPRLMTLRGAEVLRQADVVVYDRLAAPALLDLAPGRAERIYAGKEPGAPTLEQEEINELLVSRARAGSVVVRLKGGDPFVFGRGGEEALACAGAGVPFEVVPGVSSATAVPAYAGIPLTHRGIASSFAVVTASTAQGREADLQRVSMAVDTLVVLMAAGKLEQVCAALIAGAAKSQFFTSSITFTSTPRARASEAMRSRSEARDDDATQMSTPSRSDAWNARHDTVTPSVSESSCTRSRPSTTT
jgi:uroporphyrin-III C-methyltransferase